MWAHVHDWAASFPGYQSFEVVDDKVSRWTVKVKLGSLTRTAVEGHRDQPTHIAFTLEGETEPITGSGSFDAAVGRDSSTDVRIGLAVAGSGSPAMEAMSRPVLPRLGTAFAEVLRRDIEAAARPAEAVPEIVEKPVEERVGQQSAERGSRAVPAPEPFSVLPTPSAAALRWAVAALVALVVLVGSVRALRRRSSRPRQSSRPISTTCPSSTSTRSPKPSR